MCFKDCEMLDIWFPVFARQMQFYRLDNLVDQKAENLYFHGIQLVKVSSNVSEFVFRRIWKTTFIALLLKLQILITMRVTDKTIIVLSS